MPETPETPENWPCWAQLRRTWVLGLYHFYSDGLRKDALCGAKPPDNDELRVAQADSALVGFLRCRVCYESLLERVEEQLYDTVEAFSSWVNILEDADWLIEQSPIACRDIDSVITLRVLRDVERLTRKKFQRYVWKSPIHVPRRRNHD